MRFLSISFALLMVSGIALAEPVPMQPFSIDHHGRVDSAADVSFLLDAPAGKDGFIKVKDGHLVKPNGERFRIWGVNLTGWTRGSTLLPPQEDAGLWAAEMARYGINCVRFHFLDMTTRNRPRGLIDGDRNDTQAFDPEQLDRLDYFIAELKKHGIYTNLNLNVGRTYKEGDGVPDYNLIAQAKGMTFIGDRLLELQRDYAKQLLTHYNPYTKSEYRNEPAVAIVEMVNENSVFEFWMRNWLRGERAPDAPRIMLDLTPTYEKILNDKYNEWLGRNLSARKLDQVRTQAGVGPGAPVPRLRREDLTEAPKERFYAETAFYAEVEQSFFRDMERYMRETLGVKSLIVGCADHTYWIPSQPLLRGTSPLDIVDGHVYWQHPAIWGARNMPMVNDPLHSTIVKLSRSPFAGKPFTVSEVNHPNPSEYSSEMIPILAAYSAFQDWDGIFFYTFEPKIADWQPYVSDNFDITLDPVKMIQMQVGALLFLRSDVQPAKETVERSYSTEQIAESIRLPESERPYFTPGFPLSLPLRHGSRIRCLDCDPTQPFPTETFNPEGDSIVSDTNELAWHVSKENGGLVTIDTDRTQALIGFVKGHRKAIRHLSADIKNDFCTITVSSMDEKPVARATTLLLTACSRWENTGTQWNERRTLWPTWGTGPTLIEPVTGWLVLHEIEGAVGMQLIPLDGAARPIGAPIEGRRLEDGWEVPIGNPATNWYLIRVVRSASQLWSE